MKKKYQILGFCLFFLYWLSLFSSGSATLAERLDTTCQETVSAESIVLVTGFEPFDIYDVNPSQLIAEALHNQTFDDILIIGIVLPVNYSTAGVIVAEAIDYYQPVLVVSTGLSPKASSIEVEKIGVNLKQYPLENGRWSFPRRIDTKGPFIRISLFPALSISREISKSGIPAKLSVNAGRYLCNFVLYETIGYIQQERLEIPSGFLHVPLLPSQDPAGMEIGDMIQAVNITISSLLNL